jgi:hypothetical protein
MKIGKMREVIYYKNIHSTMTLILKVDLTTSTHLLRSTNGQIPRKYDKPFG